MPEASDYKAQDVFFFILNEVAEERCGLNETVDITRMVLKYVDMINLVYRHYLSLGWSEEDLIGL